MQIFCPTISLNLLDSQKFLDSVYPLFLKYLVLSETLFLIEILRGEDPTTGEDLFLGEDSFLREVSSRAVRAPGNRLPLRRKLRGIRASGISVLNQFLSLRSSYTTARGGTGTSSDWILLRWRTKFCLCLWAIR